MPNSSVSIADVAKRANVSISTVSRVINRRELVNVNTRERVEHAIKELGYHPNAFARGLMLRKSEMIGLLLPDLHGEFYSEVIRGANMQARAMGYNLVLSSAKDPDDTRSLLQGMHRRTIMDGVAVMIPEVTDRIEEILSDLHLPFVLIDGVLNGDQGDSVVIDQRAGTLAMMRHLLHTCGHERIIFLGGHETNVDTRARRDAYEQALGSAGRTVNPEDIHYLDYQYDTAYALAETRLPEWAGSKHCVFAANDEMACGVVDAAATHGLSVPQDIAVVGFDDTRVARMTKPPLTTVHVPMSDMGARAIEMLCTRLAEPDTPHTHISLRPELIVRASCGAPIGG